jgi:hypothetical protein
MVNQIYWATDDPDCAKSYDTGIRVTPDAGRQGDLLMVPGPFALRWRNRLVPRLEKGEIASYDLPSTYRFERWLDCAPRIGNDIFIKLFAHGCQDRHSFALLEGGGLDRLFEIAKQVCKSRGYVLRYVSTWEMVQAIESLALGNSLESHPNRSALVH